MSKSLSEGLVETGFYPVVGIDEGEVLAAGG